MELPETPIRNLEQELDMKFFKIIGVIAVLSSVLLATCGPAGQGEDQSNDRSGKATAQQLVQQSSPGDSAGSGGAAPTAISPPSGVPVIVCGVNTKLLNPVKTDYKLHLFEDVKRAPGAEYDGHGFALKAGELFLGDDELVSGDEVVVSYLDLKIDADLDIGGRVILEAPGFSPDIPCVVYFDQDNGAVLGAEMLYKILVDGHVADESYTFFMQADGGKKYRGQIWRGQVLGGGGNVEGTLDGSQESGVTGGDEGGDDGE